MAIPNFGNLPNLASSLLPMAVYDTLPPAIRRALQDAPYNLSIDPKRITEVMQDNGRSVHQIYELFPTLIQSGARQAYGPDHPQARINHE